MSQSKKNSGCDTDLRSHLKNQHRKVYSICRFFATNYKEHQQLFVNIIAAASQNIRSLLGKEDKQTLLLRACINMAALHSITLGMQSGTDRRVQFKSPDYQRSMEKFRDSIEDMSDLDKFRLFLEFEDIPRNEIMGLMDFENVNPLPTAGISSAKKSFLPYLKEKLIWS